MVHDSQVAPLPVREVDGEVMKLDIHEIDKHVAFLRTEASELNRKYPGARWANSKAQRFEAIAEYLTNLRRQQQMTGQGGQRIS
jgi:hypothetical protein